MNTTQIGDITEQKFILFCLENEIPVLKPVGNNLPYDCIIEVRGKLYKIQVKTGRSTKSKSTFIFNTRSTSKNYSEVVEKDYRGKIDYFVTSFKGLSDEFFILPVSEVGINVCTLYYGENPSYSQKLTSNYKFSDFIK